MTTSTVTATRIEAKAANSANSAWARMIAVLKFELRRSLELTGRAYMHGVPPL
jgi:hypothetical protein